LAIVTNFNYYVCKIAYAPIVFDDVYKTNVLQTMTVVGYHCFLH